MENKRISGYVYDDEGRAIVSLKAELDADDDYPYVLILDEDKESQNMIWMSEKDMRRLQAGLRGLVALRKRNL